ncbi:hypothetical protein CPB83DRAFT_4928 [Crepidotus variabilis]|uniref:F-box domain-containing protein n=1 Tax=Crepidotus variabilis TaxID=179855 RepID=A0A9P6ESI7_9AGAR|nr:hypothetical protein CPB83DRAFT_4928 [Crepidotus variabilis]
MQEANDILRTLTAEVLFPQNPYSSPNPQEDLNALNIVIAHVEDILTSLVLKRSPFKVKINDLNSSIIRQIPSEILSHIFTLSLIEFREVSLNRITDLNIVSPFLLGSVCRRWRDVVWSTPELWSTMYLHLSERNLKDAKAMVEEWLKRSGNLPLYIRLSCDPLKSPGSPDPVVTSKEEATALISALHRFAGRWHSLDIRLPTSLFSSFELATTATDCPLANLYIDPPDGQSDSTHTLSINPLPQLRKLHLCSVYLKSIISSWDKLTHVFAMSFYVDECLEILRRCPQLVCCKLPYIMAGDEPLYHIVHESPIVMPCIRYLQIGQDKTLPTSAILDKLVLPSLEIFKFDGCGCNDFNYMVVLGLFARSDCNLLSFTLKNVQMPDERLESILMSLPSLRQLFIYGSGGIGLTASLLSKLTDSDTGITSFLPALDTLGYTGPRHFAWTDLYSLLQLPSKSISSKLSSSEVSEDAPFLLPYKGRERFQAVRLDLSLTEEDDIVDLDLMVPLVLCWLEQGRRFELSVDSIDMVENWIQGHSPVDKDRYNYLKRQTSKNTRGDIQEEDSEWAV